MGVLSAELHNIQNEALGAVLLWSFCVGYEEESTTREPVPFPLLFIVLPILYSEVTAQVVEGTLKKSGLRAFAEKFSQTQNPQNDLFLMIHPKALRMRNLTLASFRLAVAYRLITIDTESGLVTTLVRTVPRNRFSSSTRPLISSAQKLGAWCANLSLYEVSSVLKVSF